MDQQAPVLSYAFARDKGIMVLSDGAMLELAVRDGVDPYALLEARRVLGRGFQIETFSAEDFARQLPVAYARADLADEDEAAALAGQDDLTSLADGLHQTSDLLDGDDDAPVSRLINGLIYEAINRGASDIHIEPNEDELTIRYRIDGVLQKVLSPSRRLATPLVSRIKVMSRLDIAERRVPQDGRIALSVGGRSVDLRVSTLPSRYGERVVLRLLDKQAGRLDLEHLGMPAGSLKTLESSLDLSNGIILVTGPTGSGKTTTLYASLAKLNTSRFSILTVEDPIEYYIDGIGQTQVNNKVELDFARGLRAILRQDPDIVMVGEIRDTETAEIAVQASLTGHLVLSTLHTNTAVGSVTRLRDMGIEPFLLASSLVGLVAQRLVRLLCPHCKRAHMPTEPELRTLKRTASEVTQMCTPHGCDQCAHTGYVGRQGIYEVIRVDETMRTMIHNGDSEIDIERYARTASPSITDDGMRLVVEGQTSIAEVMRVTREG